MERQMQGRCLGTAAAPRETQKDPRAGRGSARSSDSILSIVSRAYLENAKNLYKSHLQLCFKLISDGTKAWWLKSYSQMTLSRLSSDPLFPWQPVLFNVQPHDHNHVFLRRISAKRDLKRSTIVKQKQMKWERIWVLLIAGSEFCWRWLLFFFIIMEASLANLQ